MESFNNRRVEHYQVIEEGTAYGFPACMHHSIILELDNGRKCLVEKRNPDFEKNPWTTHGDVHIIHDQGKIERRCNKADKRRDRRVPHEQSAKTILAHAIKEHDGHYFLILDNCQDFVDEMVKFMNGRRPG